MGNKELALAIENTGTQKALKFRKFLLLNNSSTQFQASPSDQSLSPKATIYNSKARFTLPGTSPERKHLK